MEFNKNQPIYLQIADLICERVLLKVWKEEDRIPSVRDFALSIQVNPNTVMRAYTYLQDEYIIINQRGIGFFVSRNGYEKAKSIIASQVINIDMQSLFKKMNYLNITADELLKQYNLFLKTNSGAENEQDK
jgi:DNA-binding transcriptional regulator YhcF (GntR family)